MSRDRNKTRGRTRRALLICAALFVPFGFGCNEGADPAAGDGQAANQESAAGNGSGEDGGTDERIEALVSRVDESLEDAFARRAEPPDLVSRVESRMADAIAVATQRGETTGDARPDRDLWYEGTIDTWYQTRAYAPAFTHQGHLTPASRALFASLEGAAKHGLDPADYHVEEIRPLVERSVALTEQMEANVVHLDPAEQAALVEYLESNGFAAKGDEAVLGIETMLLEGDQAGHPVPRMREAFARYQESEVELSEIAIELEVKLADGYLRFARDMRHRNVNAVNDVETAAYGMPPIDPTKHTEIVLARLAAQLDLWPEDADQAEAEAHLRALWPEHAQYAKLVEGYEKYKAIVDAGGWKEVDAKALRIGKDSNTVRAVKERFAAEGYWDGPIDNAFDDAFTEAMKTYQETHQLDVDGESSKSFWRSLNIDAETRLQQIEVNLRRWRRDSHIVPSDYFVYINVPDFHAEVWRDGVRDMRFRIVVGNKEKKCDPDSETMVFANATPLQRATMEYLELNPYWNVPPRIEKEEYVPKMQENPNWLEENGFEYYTDDRGSYTVLRQVPGDGNALGRVKFIFPNVHATFMHDTPSKGFFRYPVRAFSHGCMRVQDPMDLAEYLLRNEGKWESSQRYIDNVENRAVNFDKPLDVFIDYTTVRVDDQGRVNFLADVYRYVQHEIEGAPPSRSCTPAPPMTLAEARASIEPDDGVEVPDFAPILLEGSDGAAGNSTANPGAPVEPGTQSEGATPSPAPDAPAGNDADLGSLDIPAVVD